MDDYQAADVKYKRRDYVLKLIGGLFVVIGAVVGLIEYGVSIKKEIAFKEADIQGEESRALLDKQFELYFEASRLAAAIATEVKLKAVVDLKQLAMDKHLFETLYYGPMVIVEERSKQPISSPSANLSGQGKYTEDADVEKRMIEFHRCAFEDEKNCNDARNLALALADSCRISLAKRSGSRIEELQKSLPIRKWLTTREVAGAP
jgi:hypothetical protein